MSMPGDTTNQRISKACVSCNKKKIRCKFSSGNDTCLPCSNLNIQCVPRTRKKRKLAISQSLSNDTAGEGQNDNSNTLRFQPWSSPHDQDTWGHGNAQTAIDPPSSVQATVATTWRTNSEQGVSYGNPLTAGHSNTSGQQLSLPPLKSNLQIHPEANQALGRSVLQNADETGAYVGRSHYIAQDVPIDENSARAYGTSKKKELSEMDINILELRSCFDLPPRAARQSLVDTFTKSCYPWTPILESQGGEYHAELPSSLLVTQAMFLAASRVSSAPGVVAYASSDEFYHRAKTLFWIGHESNPLAVITATVMLNWYNPDGPEHVSFDTSRFWLQIGVGLAHQIGLHKEPPAGKDRILRRRLWWSLYTRDSLISAGQGRPRAINIEDSDVQPPCLEDFPNSRQDAELFISYVEICSLLGNLTESSSRKQMTRSKRQDLTRALFKWTRTLPEFLRLYQMMSGSDHYILSPYNFNARQLHLPYFIILVIMERATSQSGIVSPVTVLAASFIAGIFEEFLARDELQYLGSICTFYLLAAGVALVSVRPYTNLWEVAQKDIEVVQNSLRQLSTRWPSATGALKALQHVIERQNPNSSPAPLEQLNYDQKLFFQGFCHDLCRLWIPYREAVTANPISTTDALQNETTELATAEILGTLRYPFSLRMDQVSTPLTQFSTSAAEAESHLSTYYDGIGNWLLSDWGSEMLW